LSPALTEALARIGADVAVISVSSRETAGTANAADVALLPRLGETWVMGESVLGVGVLGSLADRDRFEAALAIMSGGGFPSPGQRDTLSDGNRRLLRDATILLSHARDKRDVFITTDTKAFGHSGTELRRRLEELFSTRIMTPQEFLASQGYEPGA
jgi:hypothetical protein